ncbi:hypothetical protein [Dokdonia sp.]|uniref:hypothetical protein n=1 Tax=Dokdonia sp. TaxID=2024995 RepID=UPI00326656AE
MKTWIAIISFFILLQTDSCSSDDSSDDGGFINENFVEFLGVRSDANGGCNIETTTGNFSCTYAGAFTSGGLNYAIAVTHEGLCRTASFNLRDNLDQPSNAVFILQATSDGVAVETYFGNTGTINVTDSGTVTSLRFNGTVINTATGDEETIEGFVECIL